VGPSDQGSVCRGSNAYADPDGYTYANANGNPDANTDADSDTDPYAYSDSDADAYSYTWSLHADPDGDGRIPWKWGRVSGDHSRPRSGDCRHGQHRQRIAGIHCGQCDERERDDTTVPVRYDQPGHGDVYPAESITVGRFHAEGFVAAVGRYDTGSMQRHRPGEAGFDRIVASGHVILAPAVDGGTADRIDWSLFVREG
jgi:hypothetical protein